MRLSPVLTVLSAVIAVIVIGAVAALLIQPPRALLTGAGLSLATITPNADGADDVTEVHFTLNHPARISIFFTEKSSGRRYDFRSAQPHEPGDFKVLFSGVVDGFALPAEPTDSSIEARLIPNGDYTWSIEAMPQDSTGAPVTTTGPLTVANADTALPAILDFNISPKVFTPNQDGIDDRAKINVYLAKPATLVAFLEDKTQQRFYLSEHIEGRQAGEEGAHVYDYDGGVDNNITPPPDGDYTVVVTAQDKVGQRVRRTSSLTLKDGGLPNAEIAAQATGGSVFYQTASWQAVYYGNLSKPGQPIANPGTAVLSTQAMITMPQGDLLVFRLTVHNYGTTPIRTIGPWPGTVYEYNQPADAMTDEPRSGAWRVGLQCEGSETTLPWRWAIGSQDQLVKVERNTDTLWYLPPGKTAVVWGAIRMTKLIKTRNPQECSASLIHEDVIIPPKQSNIGPIKVNLTATQPAP